MVKRVLVVEDNPGTQALIRNMLLGIEPQLDVQCVSDAETAYRNLSYASKDGDPYDVVVADVNLPGSSGLTLWDISRAQQPDLDFCFVSGMSYDDWTHRAGRFVDVPPFLQKPISLAKLRQFWRERYQGVGVFTG
jgi:CheY-like chemotaxis protein